VESNYIIIPFERQSSFPLIVSIQTQRDRPDGTRVSLSIDHTVFVSAACKNLIRDGFFVSIENVFRYRLDEGRRTPSLFLMAIELPLARRMWNVLFEPLSNVF
jgi:hypothetical protein